MTKHAFINRRKVLLSAGALSLAAATAHAGGKDLPPEDLTLSTNGRFVHDNALFGDHSDLTGYYYPNDKVQTGTFNLVLFHIGIARDLVEFEQKGQTKPAYAPFMFHFEDLSSSEVETDFGTRRGNSSRVFPDRYSITRDHLNFDGFDRQVGRVRFRGRFTEAFLGPRPYDEKLPDVTGTLTLNGTAMNELAFRYWMGD